MGLSADSYDAAVIPRSPGKAKRQSTSHQNHPAPASDDRTSPAHLVPEGERPVDVQRRIVTLLTRLAGRHRTGTIALMSHAEVIRSAVLWFSGRSLDDFHQCAIDTASISGLLMSARPGVLFVNATDDSPLQLSHQHHTLPWRAPPVATPLSRVIRSCVWCARTEHTHSALDRQALTTFAAVLTHDHCREIAHDP